MKGYERIWKDKKEYERIKRIWMEIKGYESIWKDKKGHERIRNNSKG